jgi:hypothetical protein
MRPGAPGVVGYNPYTYAGSNPTTFTDPSGNGVGELTIQFAVEHPFVTAGLSALLACGALPAQCQSAARGIAGAIYALAEALQRAEPKPNEDAPTWPDNVTPIRPDIRPVPPEGGPGQWPKVPPDTIIDPIPLPKPGDDPKADPNGFVVRLQAQGAGLEESVVLAGPVPVTVAEGLAGLDALGGKLSRRDLAVRADPFRRAERFIRSAPAGGGVAPPGQSFALRNSDIRVDVEILRGINFRW